MELEKMWVKFNEMDVVCWCYSDSKKCLDETCSDCKLYLVKFIEIEYDEELDGKVTELNNTTSKLGKDVVKKLKDLNKAINKNKRELDKSIKKFKI